MSALTIELSELRKLRGVISKKITVENGRPKSDGSGCQLTVGKARRNLMNGSHPAGAFADYLDGMDSKTALTLGRMCPAVATECRVASKRRMPDYNDDDTPTITRSLDNFSFAPGPGWALIDHDTKGMPASARPSSSSWAAPRGRLRHLIAGYDDAAHVTRAAPRAGSSHTETGEQFPGSGGRHDYVLLADQRDAPRFLKVLASAGMAGRAGLAAGRHGRPAPRAQHRRRVGRVARAAGVRGRAASWCRRWPRTGTSGGPQRLAGDGAARQPRPCLT